MADADLDAGATLSASGHGVHHEACPYLGLVLGERDNYWFCNKCGRGGEIVNERSAP